MVAIFAHYFCLAMLTPVFTSAESRRSAISQQETTVGLEATNESDANEMKMALKDLWKEVNPKADSGATKNDKSSRRIELDHILRSYEPRIKEVESYVIKPQHWMLEFFDHINVALVKRKYKYMRAKRDEIQEVMNEAYGFIALTALTSPGHLDEGQVCTEKGLSTVIGVFIRAIHQTPLEVIKIVKLMRVRLLKYFYNAGPWDEQIAADVYTFFKLMVGTRNRFDEMAAEVEYKWEERFEETRKQVIEICHVEVGEVEERIHEAIGDSWEKLNDTSDAGLNEDELLEGVLGLQVHGPEPDGKEYPYFSSSSRPRKAEREIPVKKTEPHVYHSDEVPPDWHLRLYDSVSP